MTAPTKVPSSNNSGTQSMTRYTSRLANNMANSIPNTQGKEKVVGWVAPQNIHKSKNNGLRTGSIAYREANN